MEEVGRSNAVTRRIRTGDRDREEGLLLKLKVHGIGSGMINWIENWLIDRRQRVVVDREVF